MNIIYFEGLFSSFIRGLLIPQLPTGPTAWWSSGHPHYSSGPKAPRKGGLIVIGHSLGGPSAIRWAASIDRPVDLLITLDPRVFYRPYVVPSNVKRAVNFRRNSWWMHGYEVQGALNIVMNCGHGVLPGQPEVVKLVESYL